MGEGVHFAAGKGEKEEKVEEAHCFARREGGEEGDEVQAGLGRPLALEEPRE